MAAGNQESVKERIIDERMTTANDIEPLFESEMSLQNYGEYSLRHGVPREVSRLLNLSAEDDVVVYAYQNGYWVEPAGGSDE